MTTYTVTKPSERFFLHQGPPLESLEDLFSELQTMEGWQFSLHVTPDKPDFATWVAKCFDDKYLAKKMNGARSIDDLQKEIFVSLFR